MCASVSEPILRTDGLSVIKQGVSILRDISLSVSDGARVLVQGPSGAGKTTLFTMLGLLDTPTVGRVFVDDTETTVLSERQRARLRREQLGFVFQDFQLVPDLTARENAALPQTHAGTRDEAWLTDVFEMLQLQDRADSYPATLSGGEKQRVAIARALANRPAVILADEPTGQLDPTTTDRVISLLTEIQASVGTALVTISHDPALNAVHEDVYTLRDGQLATHGDKDKS